jgi:hypothetical protein
MGGFKAEPQPRSTYINLVRVIYYRLPVLSTTLMKEDFLTKGLKADRKSRETVLSNTNFSNYLSSFLKP